MKEILQQIGLTRGESDVYLTLVRIGNTTSGELIKKSGVSRSKVYEVLERLKQKGLVTEMIQHNTKHFEATSPNRIVDYLHLKEEEVQKKIVKAQELVPQLTKLQKSHLERQETKIYTGIEGWRTVYKEILDHLQPEEEYLAFAVGNNDLESNTIRRFFKNFHLQRAEKKIAARLIMEPSIKPLIEKEFAHIKKWKCKYLHMGFPTNINIHGDNVVTLVAGENPVAFLIHSKQVADRYRNYFESLWKKAKL